VNRRSVLDIFFSVAGGIVLLFLVAPLASTFFRTTPASFWETLRDPEVLDSIRLTFLAALAAVAFGFLTGVPLAYLFARRSFLGKRLLQAIVNLPLVIPHTAAGVALLLVFGRGFPGDLSRGFEKKAFFLFMRRAEDPSENQSLFRFDDDIFPRIEGELRRIKFFCSSVG
jgi:ABC-type sulfate transport system permease component